MAISINPKPTIYRNLYENTDAMIYNIHAQRDHLKSITWGYFDWRSGTVCHTMGVMLYNNLYNYVVVAIFDLGNITYRFVRHWHYITLFSVSNYSMFKFVSYQIF